MTVFPIAKINLGLNVVARREDGYHDLETVFWPVTGIHDELTVEASQHLPHGTCNLILGTDIASLCPPEKNLVVKAYNLLKEDFDLPGVDITLKKSLPSQAGMGGGSSDGAYMIKALNELFHLSLSDETMEQYAARLGADCAFFIKAKPAYATGIGDKLTTLHPSLAEQQYTLVLIKPDVAVSTKEAYAGITPGKPQHNCRDVVMNQPIEKWRDMLTNDFEESIFPKLPVLQEIKEQLYKDGALYAAMSGSGSTIFGIFNHKPSSINHKPSSINHKSYTINPRYAKYYHQILTF